MKTDTEPTKQTLKTTSLALPTSSDFIFVPNQHSPKCHPLKSYFKKKYNFGYTKKILEKRIPIFKWLPQYDCNSAIGDLVAGITVALTIIPQGLAYASIAQLPVQYGLYTSFLGSFVYIFFGSCKDSAIGPTAISTLVVNQVIKGKGPEYTILLCFLTGIVQFLMGVLGLGFLIDFISGPVSSGFTSAGAVIVVTSQIRDLLGINVSGSSFLEDFRGIVKEIKNTRIWDTVLGIACIAILLALKLLSKVRVGPKANPTKCQTATNTILWVLSISRNSILVVFSTIISYYCSIHGEYPFKIVGYVPAGFPTVQPPHFSTSTENFFEIVSDMKSGILVLAVLGLLEDIAVCKVFANGKPVDATQELLAIGLSNVANSFVQGFPGSAALARSAVNNASGVKTPLGGLYTSFVVIMALLFFTPYFEYIPKSTLAAIIIAAAIFMVEVKVVKPMWRAKKIDLGLALVTFIFCLATRLEYGILVGIAINVIFILYQAARPKISVEKTKSPEGVEYLLVTPDRCLIFPSADYVRNLVIKQSVKQGIPVVIDCTHIYGADYTAARVIESLTKDFTSRNQPLFFYNLKSSVSSVFAGLNLDNFLVYYNEEELDEMLKKQCSGNC